jgi:hypothetical protein
VAYEEYINNEEILFCSNKLESEKERAIKNYECGMTVHEWRIFPFCVVWKCLKYLTLIYGYETCLKKAALIE